MRCSLALLLLAAEIGGLVAQASSLRGLVLASTKPRRLEACATKPFERTTDGRKSSSQLLLENHLRKNQYETNRRTKEARKPPDYGR
jgi:hypothetical protein